MAAPWDSAATAVIPVYLINEAACQKVGPLLTQRNQITFRWVKETVQAQLGVDVDGSDAYTLLALSRAGPVPMDGDVAVKQHVAGLDAKDCLRIAVEGGELFADMADDPALRRRSVVNSLRLSGLSGDPRSSVRTPLAPSEAAASQRQPASAPQVGGRAAVSATSAAAAAAAATSGAAAAVAFASVPMVTASPAVGVGTGGAAAAGIAPARAAMASGMAMGIHPGAHNFGSGLEGLRLHGPVTYGHGMPPMNSSGGLRMSSSGLSGIGRMSTSGLSQMSGLRMSSSGLNVRMSGSGFSVGSFGDGGSIGPSRRVVPSGSGDTISDITMGSQGGGFMFGDLGALSSMHSNGSAMSGLQPTFSGFSAASNGSFGVGVPRARRAQPSIRHGGPAINNLVGTAGEPGSNDSPATIVARMTEQREAAAKALCMRSDEHKKVYERLRFLLYDPSKLHSPDYDAAMSFTAGTELLPAQLAFDELLAKLGRAARGNVSDPWLVKSVRNRAPKCVQLLRLTCRQYQLAKWGVIDEMHDPNAALKLSLSMDHFNATLSSAQTTPQFVRWLAHIIESLMRLKRPHEAFSLPTPMIAAMCTSLTLKHFQEFHCANCGDVQGWRKCRKCYKESKKKRKEGAAGAAAAAAARRGRGKTGGVGLGDASGVGAATGSMAAPPATSSSRGGGAGSGAGGSVAAPDPIVGRDGRPISDRTRRNMKLRPRSQGRQVVAGMPGVREPKHAHLTHGGSGGGGGGSGGGSGAAVVVPPSAYAPPGHGAGAGAAHPGGAQYATPGGSGQSGGFLFADATLVGGPNGLPSYGPPVGGRHGGRNSHGVAPPVPPARMGGAGGQVVPQGIFMHGEVQRGGSGGGGGGGSSWTSPITDGGVGVGVGAAPGVVAPPGASVVLPTPLSAPAPPPRGHMSAQARGALRDMSTNDLVDAVSTNSAMGSVPSGSAGGMESIVGANAKRLSDRHSMEWNLADLLTGEVGVDGFVDDFNALDIFAAELDAPGSSTGAPSSTAPTTTTQTSRQ